MRRFTGHCGLAMALCAAAGPAAADDLPSLQAALTGGTASLEERARYEHDEVDAPLKDADALTVRTRLSYATGTWNAHSLGVTLENVSDWSDDAYNSGLNGHTDYATVADPTGSALTDLFVKFTGLPDTVVKAGRQHLVLDNARWIGDSDWRQKATDYDAVVATFSGVPDTTLTYGFLWRASLPSFTQVTLEGHLVNAAWKPWPALGATAYLYQFNFADDSAARRDTRSFGLRLAGSAPLGGASVFYALEGARQEGFSSAPDSVHAPYALAELGVKAAGATLKAGFERRGSNGDAAAPYAVQTPFATGHAFGGWSDLFVTAPPGGLRDSYVSLGYVLAGYEMTLVGHDQRADFDGTAAGSHYGQELDAQLRKPLGKNFALLAGGAAYDAKDFGVDTRKLWVQARFAF